LVECSRGMIVPAHNPRMLPIGVLMGNEAVAAGGLYLRPERLAQPLPFTAQRTREPQIGCVAVRTD
jgi:hypothetical protein